MLKTASPKKTVAGSVSHTSHHLKIISIVLLVIGLFFSLLTFVYLSANQSATGAGMGSKPYHMLIVITTLAAVLVIMEFYTTSHKGVMGLRLSVMISLLGTVGYMIYLLRRGADSPPWSTGQTDGNDLVSYTYGCLTTGFLGAGVLFSFVYNFHNVVHRY